MPRSWQLRAASTPHKPPPTMTISVCSALTEGEPTNDTLADAMPGRFRGSEPRQGGVGVYATE